ncbi:MAG: adenylate/guanylate cyclase domain-containing protein [Bacteroidota bacterium]|nr:adenylate/guanylate cyclase domain-containing protein [Bacteroidota bacterium]
MVKKSYLFTGVILVVLAVTFTDVYGNRLADRTNSHNQLVISGDSTIDIFNGIAWTHIPVLPGTLATIDKQNNILIANQKFIGKLEFQPHKSPIIDTILMLNGEEPVALFTLNKNVYFSTRNSLFRIKDHEAELIDSSDKGLKVWVGKEYLYVVKNDGRIARIDNSNVVVMPSLSGTLEGGQIHGFWEIAADKPALKPLYFQWWAWVCYVCLLSIVILLYWLNRRSNFLTEKFKLEQLIKQRTAELTYEKEKTDELLANLLPKDTVDELKYTGKASSKKFSMVTVLFSDIQGFTKIVEEMNPEKLVDELDNFFFHFDSVVEKYNIEKIKTIGDAYMCAGGIPYKNRTNPVEVVLAGLEVQEYMRQLKKNNNNIWDLRIGIHTGAVIAGVVGHKRMSYDIWGDTVNTASRMESSGEPGKVNISGQCYELIKDFFVCEYRGKMPVKYKGDIDMYFVNSIRPELSVDQKIIPNHKFIVKLQMLRLYDLEEFMIEKLNNELSKDLYFHNAGYTQEIYSSVGLIGKGEGISEEDLLLVRTAALLLNSGFIDKYSHYEEASINYARQILPMYKYSPEQIDQVATLMKAVVVSPLEAKNKLQAVLSDAIMTYLGRPDFLEQSLKHYKEKKIRDLSVHLHDWLNKELSLIEKFQFHTNTAKSLREVSVEKQVQKIRDFAKFR